MMAFVLNVGREKLCRLIDALPIDERERAHSMLPILDRYQLIMAMPWIFGIVATLIWSAMIESLFGSVVEMSESAQVLVVLSLLAVQYLGVIFMMFVIMRPFRKRKFAEIQRLFDTGRSRREYQKTLATLMAFDPALKSDLIRVERALK